MSSISSALMQTCTTTNSFCPLLATLIASIGSYFNNQDLKTYHRTPRTPQRKLLRSSHQLEGRYPKEIQLYLALNINSLSQIMNNDSTDFSLTDGFVHSLQLQKEEQSSWEVETVRSLEISREQLEGGDANSTRSRSWDEGQCSSELSEVEEMEL